MSASRRWSGAEVAAASDSARQQITITDRPFLAPCGIIEERIRQFFP